MTSIDTSAPFYNELIVAKKHWEEAPVQGTRIAFTQDAQMPKWIGHRIKLLNQANDYYDKVQTGELADPHPDIVLQFSRAIRFWRHPIQYVRNLAHMKQIAKNKSVAIDQLKQSQEFQSQPYGFNVAKKRWDGTPIQNPHIAFNENAQIPKSLIERIKLLNQLNEQHAQEEDETTTHPDILLDNPAYFWEHPVQYLRNLVHMKRFAKGKYIAARELDPELKFRPGHAISSNPLSAENRIAIEKAIRDGFEYMDASWAQHLSNVLSNEDVSDRQVFSLLQDARPEEVQFLDEWDSLMNLLNEDGESTFHQFMTRQELDALVARTQQRTIDETERIAASAVEPLVAFEEEPKATATGLGAAPKTIMLKPIANNPERLKELQRALGLKDTKEGRIIVQDSIIDMMQTLKRSAPEKKDGLQPPLSVEDKKELPSMLQVITAEGATEQTIRGELYQFLNNQKMKDVVKDVITVERNRIVRYKGPVNDKASKFRRKGSNYETVLHPDTILVYKLRKKVNQFLENSSRSLSFDTLDHIIVETLPLATTAGPLEATAGPASWSTGVPR
jgi:hypothetical protein